MDVGNPYDPYFDPEEHAAFERLTPLEKVNVAAAIRAQREDDTKRRKEQEAATKRQQGEQKVAEIRQLTRQFHSYALRARPDHTHKIERRKSFGRREVTQGWVLAGILLCSGQPRPERTAPPATTNGGLPGCCDSINHRWAPLWVTTDGQLYYEDRVALDSDLVNYSPEQIMASIIEYVKRTRVPFE